MALPWAALASKVGCFYGVCVPLQPEGVEWWIFADLLLTAVMLGCGVRVTCISPHVPAREKHRTFGPHRGASAPCPQCGVQRLVESRTHHCYFCNRWLVFACRRR